MDNELNPSQELRKTGPNNSARRAKSRNLPRIVQRGIVDRRGHPF